MMSKQHSKRIEVEQIRSKWINRILFTSTLSVWTDLNVDIYTMNHRGTLTYHLMNNSRVLYNKSCKETYQSRKVNNGQTSRNCVLQTLEWTLLTNLPSQDRPLWKGQNGFPPLADNIRFAYAPVVNKYDYTRNKSWKRINRQKASQTLHANNTVFARVRII
jgi:hypothetical protein